jgi:parvulin-like peptidyl-prolyl isomerase
MKKIKTFLIIIAVFLSVISYSETVNKIVAIINNEIITDFDINIYILFDKAHNLKYEDVLNKLIEEQLIIASAKDREYEIVDQEIDYNIDQTIANQRSQFPTDEAFMKALKNEGLTLAGLKENYRKQIKNQFLKEKIIEDKIKKKISVSTGEVGKYYENNKEKYLKLPKTYTIDSIYTSAVDKEGMLSEYNKIKKGYKIKKELIKKEFNPLYLEYLTEDQKPLFDKKCKYTNYTFNKKGLSFYKIIKWDSFEPNVIYYTIPYRSSNKGFLKAEKSVNDIMKAYKEGIGFENLISKSDNDTEELLPSGKITLPAIIKKGLQKEFENLNPGDLKVIKAQKGYYIVKLLSVNDKIYEDVGGVYTRIYQELYNKKFKERYDKLILTAKKENYLKVYK